MLLKNSNVTKSFGVHTEKKKGDKLSNPLPPLISTGEHNPGSKWKLTRLRQVGYRLDTSRYLLTVSHSSQTRSHPSSWKLQRGKKKKRKRIWKIKTEGDRKEERIQFFFVVDNHRVDGRGRTMHHDGQLHKQDSRRLIIGLTGYPMYSISYLRFPRLWLHQFSLKKWRSVTGIVTSQINCELADVIERWIQ